MFDPIIVLGIEVFTSIVLPDTKVFDPAVVLDTDVFTPTVVPDTKMFNLVIKY